MGWLPSAIDDLLWPSPDHRRKCEYIIKKDDPVRHAILYGPPGTGKTSAMNLIAIEVMKLCGCQVSNLREAIATGDVLHVDDEFGYTNNSIDAINEWSRMFSLNGNKRKVIIVDEIDNYRMSQWSKWKLMLDRFGVSNIQVVATTNNVKDIDRAVLDRFEKLHMTLDTSTGREIMRMWLIEHIARHQLRPMSAVAIANALNRAQGSVRVLVHEVDQWNFE